MNKPKFVTRQDADRGFELQLVDDTGQKIEWFITVAGVDSEAYRGEQREQQKRRLERVQRLLPSPEQIDAEVLDLLTAATIGWRGIELDGQEAAFSRENARRLYTELPQVADQVDRALHTRANFLPRSGTS